MKLHWHNVGSASVPTLVHSISVAGTEARPTHYYSFFADQTCCFLASGCAPVKLQLKYLAEPAEPTEIFECSPRTLQTL